MIRKLNIKIETSRLSNLISFPSKMLIEKGDKSSYKSGNELTLGSLYFFLREQTSLRDISLFMKMHLPDASAFNKREREHVPCPGRLINI